MGNLREGTSTTLAKAFFTKQNKTKHPKESTEGDTPYSRRVYVPFPNHPFPWTTGAHNPGANIKVEIRFGANIAKKRVSRPKNVYSEGFISGSLGRWTLGLCMEVIQARTLIYQHEFMSEAQKNNF